MKRAFEMLLNFLAVLICALIIGMSVYILYATTENLVAGHSVSFPKILFLYGLFKNAPTVLLLMVPFMLVYKIRHLASPVATSITYVILCSLVWFCLMPLSQIGKNAVFGSDSHNFTVKTSLSGGYFRKVNDKFYYFIHDEDGDTKTADVLEIFDAWNPDSFGSQISLQTGEASDFSNAAKPYKDSLVKQNLRDMPERMLKIIQIFNKSVERAWLNGYASWLCFCSLGFVMAAAYSFVAVSSWRLINFTYVILIQIFAIIVNTFYYLDSFFDARLWLNRLFYGADFSRFAYFQGRFIQMPLLAVNLACGILVILTGITATAIKRRRWA